MNELEKRFGYLPKMSPVSGDEPSAPSGGGKGKDSKSKKSTTPVLDTFGRDLTVLANEGKLDPIIGRKEEIERVSQILSRRKKNNPILIGEPGVGKTAVAEGLAIKIMEKKVSRILFDKRIVTLDLGTLVAGTKYRGQFEERMKSIMNEVQDNDNIILFIDEIHTMVGAGGTSGSLDAANILKPSLARGEMQCIGATTLDEFRQHIEKDGALARRFQKVVVEPTSPEDTMTILNNIKDKYEDHHNVIYTDEALKACVDLTERYITDRNLPDKAIDALDETGSRVHISNIIVPKEITKIEKKIEDIKVKKKKVIQSQKYEEAANLRDVEKQLDIQLAEEKEKWEKSLKENRKEVGEREVSEVVSMMTGIPVDRVSEDEGNKLVNLDETIKGKVIGQDEAVQKVVKAIKRNRSGLKDPNTPIGTFIFLGDTGVGKTQLAKVLAENMFEGKDSLIRVDMSEYMEKFSVSRLIGAPPGYVGHDEGGQLTEAVRNNPYSIVLLDEIEKAHPDVFNLLLQLLDEGTLTDSLGRKVNFKNTIVIMTSNIGSRQLSDFGTGVGFSTGSSKTKEEENTKGVIQSALKKAFAPEFLNRIDDVIMFRKLDEKDIGEIVEIELEKLIDRVDDLGYKMKFSKKITDYIVEKGFSKDYGARPLKRAIQKYIEDVVAEEMISNTKIAEGSTISISYKKKEDEVTVKITEPKKSKSKPKSKSDNDSDGDDSDDNNNNNPKEEV
jgi:ATP-dependent Clp protease ATP-binding subunit ClpC